MIARTALGKVLVFSVFFLGIATGAVLDRAYRARVDAAPGESQRPEQSRLSPQERAKRDQDRMAEFFGLDQTQQEQIRKILDETRAEFKSLREKTDPEFTALREKTRPLFKAIEDGSRTKIRVVLNEEQRQKMDEFLEKRGSRSRPSRSGERSDKSDRQDRR